VHAQCRTLDEGWIIGAPAAVTPEIDENRLVRLAQEGDRAAFEGLYRLHVGRIYALCLRLTGQVSEAEDMTQESFIRAWQKIGSFQGRSRFSSWLHRLTVNVVLNERRARGRSAPWVALPEDGAGADPPSPAPSPAAAADREKAIASLPEGARIVFVLHEVYGYRHEEISGMSGMAVGTSKAHLHRARKLLREMVRP